MKVAQKRRGRQSEGQRLGAWGEQSGADVCCWMLFNPIPLLTVSYDNTRQEDLEGSSRLLLTLSDQMTLSLFSNLNCLQRRFLFQPLQPTRMFGCTIFTLSGLNSSSSGPSP